MAPATPPVYSPLPHGFGCVAPSTGQYEFTGQAWHAAATLLLPVTVPNVPTGHGAHAPPSTPYVPAAHSAQALALPAVVKPRSHGSTARELLVSGQ